MAFRAGIEKIREKGGRGILFWEHLQKLLGRLADDKVLRQSLTKRDGLSIRIGNLFIAGKALVLENALD